MKNTKRMALCKTRGIVMCIWIKLLITTYHVFNYARNLEKHRRKPWDPSQKEANQPLFGG